MKIVFCKFALVSIFVGEFKYSNAMLHPAAPVSFVLSSRQKVIASVAINLIVDKTTRVPLPWLIVVITPSAFLSFLHFPLITVSVFIFYIKFTLSQVNPLDLLKIIIFVLWIISVLFRLAYLYHAVNHLLGIFLSLLHLNYLYFFVALFALRCGINLHSGLRLLNLKKLTVVDFTIFEKVDGILMKLLLANLVSNFKYFLIQKCLPVLSQKHLNQIRVRSLKSLVNSWCLRHARVCNNLNRIEFECYNITSTIY